MSISSILNSYIDSGLVKESAVVDTLNAICIRRGVSTESLIQLASTKGDSSGVTTLNWIAGNVGNVSCKADKITCSTSAELEMILSDTLMCVVSRMSKTPKDMSWIDEKSLCIYLEDSSHIIDRGSSFSEMGLSFSVGDYNKDFERSCMFLELLIKAINGEKVSMINLSESESNAIKELRRMDKEARLFNSLLEPSTHSIVFSNGELQEGFSLRVSEVIEKSMCYKLVITSNMAKELGSVHDYISEKIVVEDFVDDVVLERSVVAFRTLWVNALVQAVKTVFIECHHSRPSVTLMKIQTSCSRKGFPIKIGIGGHQVRDVSLYNVKLPKFLESDYNIMVKDGVSAIYNEETIPQLLYVVSYLLSRDVITEEMFKEAIDSWKE